jgi:hypothetical protein
MERRGLGSSPHRQSRHQQIQQRFPRVVKGFGSALPAQIQWKLDDQILPGGGPVKLDLDTPPQIQSNASLKAGGAHVLSMSLVADDRLKGDNSRYRVIDVAAELKVLIVEGDRGVGLLSGSAAYLDLALAPPKEAGAPARASRRTATSPRSYQRS